MAQAAQRHEELRRLAAEASVCTRCPQLVQTRTQVVFGSGSADAQVMFVGEAPGRAEDEQGVPFVGASGRLLSQLLGEIGLAREDVFIANTLKCRPPDNRNPLAAELDNCSGWLMAQLELVRPAVVCTLGNFATRLLRGDSTPISKVRGQVEVREIGGMTVRLLPLLHPAAALYTRSNLELLRADFAVLAQLVGLGAPEPEAAPGPEAAPELELEPTPAPAPRAVAVDAGERAQLPLF